MTLEQEDDVKFNHYFACFGGIIHSSARLEWVIQGTMAAVAELAIGKVTILTRDLGYAARHVVLIGDVRRVKPPKPPTADTVEGRGGLPLMTSSATPKKQRRTRRRKKARIIIRRIGAHSTGVKNRRCSWLQRRLLLGLLHAVELQYAMQPNTDCGRSAASPKLPLAPNSFNATAKDRKKR